MTAITASQICAALGQRPQKIIARRAGVHPATAGRWQRGETVPDALSLVRLMAADPGLFEAIARLAGQPGAATSAEVREHLRAALDAMGEHG